MTKEAIRAQYAFEKGKLEQYGHKSIITFEEWCEIKGYDYNNAEED